MRIDGCSAIITGGASGLGLATATELSKAGAHVVLLDLPSSAGADRATELGGSFAPADVTDEASVQQAIDTAVAQAPLRIVVNCAGLGWAGRVINRDNTPHDLGAFQFVINVNLIGTFNGMRFGAAAIAKTDPVDEDGTRGVVVNTASVAAYDGQIGQAAYSASKGGVVGMTLPIARDLSAVGIRVSTIAPGLIDTPIYGQGEAAEAFKEKLKRDVLFPNRLGTSEEFATLAVELVTNSYMNAESIRLDAGIRMQPK